MTKSPKYGIIVPYPTASSASYRAERKLPMNSHRLFRISAVWLVLCINSMGAVLFAGAPTLDDGTGFISFSPGLDCAVLLVLALPAVVGMLIPLLRRRVSLPHIPGALHYPAAYLALLADASLFLILLGGLQVLDPFSKWHLPFWGYVGLLAVGYLFFGLDHLIAAKKTSEDSSWDAGSRK